MLRVDSVLTWSAWQPLSGCWQGTSIPALPGLYRIRRAGHADLDYIGQTGSGTMTLRRRHSMLAGVYRHEMPYRDPHTAGPALWALLQHTGELFEASVAPVVGTTPWRKGLEAVALSLYRQEHGRSPTVNFGRMPSGYRMSSANNAKLVAAGRRFRGGLTMEADLSHEPGIAPVGPLGGDPSSSDWCGHAWSPWTPLTDAVMALGPLDIGLYRIRGPGRAGLVYIGEGAIRARLVAHAFKTRGPINDQGRVLAEHQPLECSWVVGAWLPHQRLELENDLIAAHVLVLEAVPPAQFIG